MQNDPVHALNGSSTGEVRVFAQDLLSTPPPHISGQLALHVAQDRFNLSPPLTRLSGERDCNFLAAGTPGQRRVLKFINPAEPLVETRLQIDVLRHLAGGGWQGLSPRHVPAATGDDHVEVIDDAGRLCRVRAYSYLEGTPATIAGTSPEQRRALGRVLATFDKAMAGFYHPGIHREFLWDVMQLGTLAPLVPHIEDAGLRTMAGRFIAAFDRSIAPALRQLRHQIIHNDLSQSNYLVSTDDDAVIAGILDFGDMAHAPLVCDLAIAASYQMGVADKPFAALGDVVSGFNAVLELLPQEHELLLDVVLARVVQRLVITEWRAASFPENRAYILRHNPEARRLLTLLEPVWRMRSRHSHAA